MLYAYLGVSSDQSSLSIPDQLILMGGFMAMLGHYFWMLYQTTQVTIGWSRFFWFCGVLFTYIFGSYLFYFTKFRPQNNQASNE